MRKGAEIFLKRLLTAVLALLMLFGSFAVTAEERGDPNERYLLNGAVERDGKLYQLRRNLTAILLMGIDKREEFDDTGLSQSGSQADFLRLIVIDPTEKKISQLNIDRDTMTPITILDVLGNDAGKATWQICLAHAFGNDNEQRCELTAKAVSELLFDAPIDLYIAMNMSGIPTLNDAIGGVTVTLEDDFSQQDPAMKVGETITLNGEQAYLFTRGRMSVGDGTNEGRMRRQQVYIDALSSILIDEIRSDKNYVGDLYDELEPYLTTNIGRGRLINEAWNARDFRREETINPTGEHYIGSRGFMEFHVDKTELEEIVFNLFYEPIVE